MSGYQRKDGDIAIFKNEKREKETHPLWKGEALIDGKKYECAFWPKGEKGTMLAGSIKPARMDERREAVQTQNESRTDSRYDFDDPSPF